MWGFLSIVVCVLTLGTAAAGRAQDIATEVSVETVRRALSAERLQLTDAWLLHEHQLERDRLHNGRWWAFGAHAIVAGGWGVVGVANLMEQGSPGWSVAAFGVGAATLAMAIATRAVEGDREGARWSTRLLALQLALAGTGLLVSQHAFERDTDVGLLLFGQGMQLLVSAAALSIMHLIAPTLYVSEHYAGYRARSDRERAEYGLSLLLEREQRQLAEAYTGFSLGVLNAAMYATVGFMAENTEARPIFAIMAGSMLIQASVNFVMYLVSRKPSDSISAGLPPPAGDKL